MSERSLRIGFVSTRLAGTDGVSLESAKWSSVLGELGHVCFYFAGECDRPAENSRICEEAHFEHRLVAAVQRDLFDDYCRTGETSEIISDLRRVLKRELHRFIADFDIELLVVENALSIPMHVPLGLALTELVSETQIPTIAHHHDFAWERDRFVVNAAVDYLHAAFPPAMPTIHHVVINSFGATQLALRTGMRSTLIPNVMDFDNPPPDPDDYTETLRRSLGIEDDEVLLLQPTRVVPRKRIERSIDLAHKLAMPCCLLVSHDSGDEGEEYKEYLEQYAQVMGVRLLFAEHRFAHQRGNTPDGRPIFSLGDAYHHAQLVTYPSRVEGFGNAFLEAIYYRRPLILSRYEVFKTDIQPKGFKLVSFGEFINRHTVEHASSIIRDATVAKRIVEENYQLARTHYSYSVLRKRLRLLVEQTFEQAY